LLCRCAVPTMEKYNRIVEVCRLPNGSGLFPKEQAWQNKFMLVDVCDKPVLYRSNLAKQYMDEDGHLNMDCPRVAQQHEVFDIIHRCHHQISHGKVLITWKKIHQYYSNISQEMVKEYIDLCSICGTQEASRPSKMKLLKPILSKTFNDRGQVDLIDMQSIKDGEFNWILHYQDHLTKFTYLRALKNKSTCILQNLDLIHYCFY
jgi:hypothetical protein